MSCFFIPSLHNLMVVDPSLLKSSENIGRDGQNQLFQNSWNLPKASNNLRSIYSRKTAESHWAGFVALQLELLPSLFAQVCSNLENQQACSHWMGRACWGASKKKKKKKGHSEALSLFDLLSSSLEKPCFIVVSWPDWSSELDLQENPVLRAFVKNNQWQLILSCWGVSSNCGNKNLTQNLKGRYENKISIKDFEKLLV